jgi:exosortase B
MQSLRLLIPNCEIILEWSPVLLGMATLFVPTFIDLANGLWNTEEHAHGPLILVIIIWLFWQKKSLFLRGNHSDDRVIRHNLAPLILGWSSLIFGLMMYILGRSQEILIFEIGSLIPILAGTLLITRGWTALGLCAFPLCYILFMIPLPGFLVDAITGPLKQNVSVIAEHLLYWAGYPIARVGVTLHIGSYRLLVADACSGLHSMFSLMSIGLLYMYLMKYKSWVRQGLLFITILPVAFSANVIRVVLLALITYHLGDEAGQGFLHDTAGLVMFIVAIGLFFLLDGLLGLSFAENAQGQVTHHREEKLLG